MRHIINMGSIIGLRGKWMDRVKLSHGSGGRLMHELIDSLFIKEFSSESLRQKRDSALLNIGGKNIAFTTDSYVVDPIFFPGGDIGSLAVNGTVNDLSVCGAKPLYLSAGIVIEAGFPMEALKRITRSVATSARSAGVKIVTGDTKVVEPGACDKIFINTSGIGEVYYYGLSVNNIKEGDEVIASGTLGDHAISILLKREDIGFKARLKSDSAPLAHLVSKALKASRRVRFMRDPTRGGVATTLNEIVDGLGIGIAIDEDRLPVSRGVRQACELLGLDPLYLACEGRVLIIVDRKDSAKVLKAVKRDPYGESAAIIGRVTAKYPSRVYLNTIAGGKRIIEMASGEQLPRIC